MAFHLALRHCKVGCTRVNVASVSKGDLELLRHVLDERRRATLRWHWSSSITMLYVEWCFLACMTANLSRKVVALGPAPLVQDKTSGTNERMLHFPNPLLMFPPLLSFMASVDMGMQLHSSNKCVINFIMINYCRDIAFADDTNLISRPVQDLTGLLHSVESRAAEEGLGAAASMCGHMRVNGSSGTGQQLGTQNGELVPVVTSQVHLGALATNDQQINEELGTLQVLP